MKIPLPNTGGQPSSTPGFSAPGTEPMRSYTGSALQSVGEGLQRAGSAVSMIERLHDEGKSNEAVGALMDALNQHVYDPTTGYHGKIGQDAIAGQDEEAMRGVTEKLVRLRNGLSNSRQRELFEREATNLMRRAELDVGQWKSKQTVAFTMGTESSAVQSNAKAAARSVGTPDFDQYLAKMGEHRDRLTTLEGFAPDSDYGNLQRMEEVTRVHASAVQAMVAGGRPTDAAEHLKKYGEQIDPQARAKLGKLVTIENDNAVAHTTALRLFDTGKPLMAQLADLRGENLSPEQFDKAWSRLRELDVVQAQQRDKDESELLKRVQNELATPGRTVASLDAETQQALADAKLDGIARKYENGKQPHLSEAGYRMRYGWTDDDIDTFSSMDELVRTATGEMPEADVRHLVERWAVVKGIATSEQSSNVERDLLVQEAAQKLGVLPDLKVGTPEKRLAGHELQTLGQLKLDLTRRYAKMFPGGGPIDLRKWDDMIDRLKGERLESNWVERVFSSSVKNVLPGSWIDRAVPVSLATPEELQRGSIQTSFGPVDLKHIVAQDGQGTPEAMRMLDDLQHDENLLASQEGRRARRMTLRDAVEEFARQTQEKSVEMQQASIDLRKRGLEYFQRLYRNNAARINISEYSNPYQASDAIANAIVYPREAGKQYVTRFGTPVRPEVNQMILAYGLTVDEVATAMREASGLDFSKNVPSWRQPAPGQTQLPEMSPQDVERIRRQAASGPTVELMGGAQ